MMEGRRAVDVKFKRTSTVMKQDVFHSRYRWVMLLLLWLLYIAFGLVSRSITPLVTPILDDLRMSYSQMGFILGSWQLTYILWTGGEFKNPYLPVP